MDISDTTILEIWNLLCDYVQASKRDEMALRYLRILTDGELELSDLEDLRGEDEYLDRAFTELDDDLIDTDEELDDED